MPAGPDAVVQQLTRLITKPDVTDAHTLVGAGFEDAARFVDPEILEEELLGTAGHGAGAANKRPALVRLMRTGEFADQVGINALDPRVQFDALVEALVGYALPDGDAQNAVGSTETEVRSVMLRDMEKLLECLTDYRNWQTPAVAGSPADSGIVGVEVAEAAPREIPATNRLILAIQLRVLYEQAW